MHSGLDCAWCYAQASGRRPALNRSTGDAPGHPSGARPAFRVDIMSSSDRWLTYTDAAALLGMTMDSLRHRARRENWAKRLNSEGKATVLVPDAMIPVAGVDAGGDAPAIRPAKRPATNPDADAVVVHLARIAELEQRIVELESDLDTARQDLDRERDGRQAERERADQATGELAAIAKQFAAEAASAFADARAREAELEARLEAVRAEVAAPLSDRPWWRRLAG